MGGVGSGRYWRWDEKATTNAMRSLDVRRWARDGLLVPGTAFGWQWSCDSEQVARINVDVKSDAVQLRYRSRCAGEEWQDMKYNVRLLSQPCHLGGVRQWFECPARGCGRRVAILYGGKVFACRHCHQLVYPSQRESYWQRYKRRAEAIENKLGSRFDECILERPKGMHRQTFERLQSEHSSLMSHYYRELHFFLSKL